MSENEWGIDLYHDDTAPADPAPVANITPPVLAVEPVSAPTRSRAKPLSKAAIRRVVARTLDVAAADQSVRRLAAALAGSSAEDTVRLATDCLTADRSRPVMAAAAMLVDLGAVDDLDRALEWSVADARVRACAWDLLAELGAPRPKSADARAQAREFVAAVGANSDAIISSLVQAMALVG